MEPGLADRRQTGVWLGLVGLGLLAVAMMLSTLVGAAVLPLSEVLGAIGARLGLGPEPDEAVQQIVIGIRLPRVLLGATVGAALAMAGASLQAVLRSPLADPYVLGVSSGAMVGATVAVLFGWSAWLGGSGVAVLGFCSAVLALLLVHSVARVGREVSATRLLLAGVAVSSLATALTGLLLVLIPEATSVRGLVFWLLGGLGGADGQSAGVALVVTLACGVGLMGLARWLDLLLLGDDAARALGIDPGRARGALVLLASLLTATSVAFAGTIAFVGLVVPHALRPLAGPGHRRLLPLSAIYGALMLVILDALARTIVAPRELPVGILTGLLGAPFFLWFLRQSRVEVDGRG